MKLDKSVVRTLIAAVAASLIAVPSLALAQPSPGDGPGARMGQPAPHAKGKRGRKGPAGKARHQFPMAGAEFVQLVDQRIAKAESRLDGALQRRNVPAEKVAAIKADFRKGSALIKAAASRAAADGTVTKPEAQKVRQVTKQVRQKARQKYGKKGKRGAKQGAKGQRFPMNGGEFTKLVNQRLAKAKSRVEQMLKRRRIAPAKAAEIKADFQKGSATVRAAASKATADGTVTQQEARKVRQVAKQVRQKAGLKHGRKGKKGNKGKKGKRAAKRGQGNAGRGPANL